MVRKAQELRVSNPGEVIFLDFGFRMDGVSRDFDYAEIVEPSSPSQEFWSRHYDVGLDDMAKLLAPERVVLCEGKSLGSGKAFDESCYNVIFSRKHPRTRFISVGSAGDLEKRMAELVPLVSQIVEGTAIIRFRDRDDLTPEEVSALSDSGVRVLGEFRNLESLLLSDSILEKLCEKHGRDEKLKEIIVVRDTALVDSVKDGKPSDDLKPTAQAVHLAAKRLLRLDRSGSTREAFMSNILAPLVTPDTEVYKKLESDVFG